MRFDILTLFPDMFSSVLATSILKRAIENNQIEVHFHDIRSAATDNHKTVDDTPYGGGAGMVLKVDILAAALDNLNKVLDNSSIVKDKRRSIMMCASGKRFRQPLAQYMATSYEQITLVCGHYEGFDERIRNLVDAELSLGDFVLTGGELPAIIIVDAVTRLLPSVIREVSHQEESFSLLAEDGTPLLEYPQYTRPLEFNGEKVPDVLLSGNHAEISRWRLEQAHLRTDRRMQDTDETI
jgi:tRNA (guanine37-N1)-methyltransferase